MIKVPCETAITYHRLYKFGELFKLNNLTLQMLEKSFSPELNTDQVFKAGHGSGKSGSFFFLTHDKKFMIKTVSKSELDIMLEILDDFILHHRQYPYSLISKIFGMFTVKRAGMSPVILCLMENTVQLKNEEMLQYKFDLKGSTYGRRTKGIVTSKTDRKDLDFLDLKKERTSAKHLKIAKINQHLIDILEKDV